MKKKILVMKHAINQITWLRIHYSFHSLMVLSKLESSSDQEFYSS